ncbi:hypothetical protein HFO49_33540 [Rhizobium leguminosarum]|uniref:hypothetical protein n=1 Tax=Rhizobium leguminosarum TaxID=384 RepID=UPI001C963A9A|nr:hypothetical protein [Rhizobium leguminosarum]MBY5592286.1 hypothetical protein [Rhizobium leguminosarum]MBY5606121.1 hypothetical protein [Rhizobium leguminosarum]
MAQGWNFLQAFAGPFLFIRSMLSRFYGGGRDISRYRVLPDSKYVEFHVKGDQWIPLAWRSSHQEAASLLEIIAREPAKTRPTSRTFDRWYDEYRAEWQRKVTSQLGPEELESLISGIKDLVTPAGGRQPTTEELMRAIEQVDRKG